MWGGWARHVEDENEGVKKREQVPVIVWVRARVCFGGLVGRARAWNPAIDLKQIRGKWRSKAMSNPELTLHALPRYTQHR